MENKYNIGLKLWATNTNYIPCVQQLYEQGVFSYVELYSVPGSYDSCKKYWKDLQNIPFTIHAPHYGNGLNLSMAHQVDCNKMLLKEAKKYADILHADYIIVHPGVNGELKETIRQFKINRDDRFLVENKPAVGLLRNLICVGSTVGQIKRIMSECKIGFCLDVGHAICAANYLEINYFYYLRQFITLHPTMYHLTDGDLTGVYDSHLHYGDGSYPLQEILSLIPNGKKITNESKKNSKENLDDFVTDIEFLNNISI